MIPATFPNSTFTTTALREAEARDLLAQHGWRMKKTPLNHPSRKRHDPGYKVTNIATGEKTYSGSRREYDKSLDDVFEFIHWCAEGTAVQRLQEIHHEFLATGGNKDEWLDTLRLVFLERDETGQFVEDLV